MAFAAGTGKVGLPSWLSADVLYAWATLILLALTVVRLLPTYTTFTGTYDEPFHIVSGLEWLERGKRTDLDQHPPLAQAATAIGLYVKGIRFPAGDADVWEKGLATLQSGGDYWGNLKLARLGVLPFLVLACVVIWLWARRWFSPAVGFWSVLLFVNLPPILGNAAVATLDMACAATFLLALYQFMRWLETPGWRSTIGMGVTFALAFLCKFSSIEFLGVCCGLAIAYCMIFERDRLYAGRRLRVRMGEACIAGLVILILLWAGYRFSSSVRLSAQVGHHESVDRWFGSVPFVHNAAYQLMERPLPLAEMALEIKAVIEHNRYGHDSCLLGQYGYTGWWYFFPVVLAVKTPIGFLLLALGGLSAVLWRWKSGAYQHCLTALFPIVILLACMPTHINLGVRHVLAVYPLLALMAGQAVSLSFKQRPWRILPVISVLAVCTVVVDAWKAHPDYLAYFNQVAGNHPEKIVCESDLDWGQDLHRLSVRLKALGVKEVGIRYFGSAMLEYADLPHYRVLDYDEKATGYYAISVRYTTMDYLSVGAYGWLKRYTPLERIGKSIDLYYIDH